MKRNHSISLLLAATLMVALPVLAQHEHHQEPAKDTTNHAMHDMRKMDHHEGMEHGGAQMTHNFSLSLPMNRNGSGTGWQPDATPMYAYMKHANKWNYMLHASIFLRYTGQNINNKNRNGSQSKFSAPNWFMGMAQRQVGKNGLLSLRGMVSLDRITDGGAGYPLLFQSGESWKGSPLVNSQHPHDLISELSVAYTQRINDKVDLTIYAGYPGEPALGPTAFMHRMSAFNNPDAVLGHHWQDATHITFGVVTAGVRYGKFKLEGSSFTGREPDENRFDFDKPKFDSYSYRLLFNPSANWALQASQAYINSPEMLSPDENVKRTTASVQHSAGLNGNNKWISSTLVWGLNNAGDHHKEHSVLLESNLQLDKWAVYGRYEWVQKSSHELDLVWYDEIPKEAFPVSLFSVGINRQLASFRNTLVQAGGQVGVYAIDKYLQPAYGKNPVSAQVYLRLTPGLMQMK
ncbi:hypothetical protein [Dyadobacter sediminis]|uniref:Alginate export domain-containing protein n=1 Tax=Dyadobacter sediminis TaxID=1493691 RepID=A0A5R9KDP9_9BACT|nr:hypothetical protein [Dyadobacter sediminis]TLU94186.1 hypothetical protein FEM55_07975 [Dyadobacter sediminis]GGB93490.1 hypothetical protein GCM10011325_21120 [Dyadobacter sediminis]